MKSARHCISSSVPASLAMVASQQAQPKPADLTWRSKPLAYMGVHGSTDGTCPITSGRNSKDRFVKNNKCTVPASVPEATSSTHVCYDYTGCDTYPVKRCTHTGGHTDLPTDPGQSKSWDMDLSWKFITQF
jgi:poly(3-hydroxybutyrate) depolymerase